MAPITATERSLIWRLQDARQQAQTALNRCPIRILRAIRVDHAGETLVLHGNVSSFYQKQLAQEVVRSVVDDVELLNTISVDN